MRRLLIPGAWATYRQHCRNPKKAPPTLRRLLSRGKSKQTAVVAMANHTARTIRAILHYQEDHRENHVSAPRSAVTRA